MKEFMALIYTQGDHMAEMSPDQQQQHVQNVGGYIQELMQSGKLKSAQPLDLSGAIVTGDQNGVQDGPFNESKEIIGGYYHLVVEDINEAVDIMKADPRFKDGPWKIEIRPIKVVSGIN